MDASRLKTEYTLDDYFELEKSTNEKFEFWKGEVWSMSGASYKHNLIVSNLNVEIGLQLREKDCNVFPSDMRVKVPVRPPYRYPDLTALCGKAEIENVKGLDLLVNPNLIIEVLSESTEGFDRGDKFSRYKSIESFSEYLLIAQHRPHVSQFVRHGDGFWMQTEYNDLEAEINLESVPCKLTLTAIYRGVEF